MRVHDVAGNGSGRYCSPRHGMPWNSRNEGSKCVSVTWRATSARPYCTPAARRIAAAAFPLGPLPPASPLLPRPCPLPLVPGVLLRIAPPLSLLLFFALLGLGLFLFVFFVRFALGLFGLFI